MAQIKSSQMGIGAVRYAEKLQEGLAEINDTSVWFEEHLFSLSPYDSLNPE